MMEESIMKLFRVGIFLCRKASTTKARSLLATLVFILALTGPAFSEGAVYTLQADGLACPFCAYGIEKQLSRIDGVDTVSTSIESGTIVISMSPGSTLLEQQAAEAVDKAGFTMRGFQGPEN